MTERIPITLQDERISPGKKSYTCDNKQLERLEVWSVEWSLSLIYPLRQQPLTEQITYIYGNHPRTIMYLCNTVRDIKSPFLVTPFDI